METNPKAPNQAKEREPAPNETNEVRAEAVGTNEESEPEIELGKAEQNILDRIETGKQIEEPSRQTLEAIANEGDEAAEPHEPEKAETDTATNEARDTSETINPDEEAEKPFSIEEHEEWKSIYEKTPEEIRPFLETVIESKNLAPEVFESLGITFELTDTDIDMKEHYQSYGVGGKVSAETHYTQPPKIVLYPRFLEINKKNPAMAQHIFSHEIGHMLASHLVHAKDYFDRVQNRPEWSYGKYTRKVKEGSQKIKPNSVEWVHEALADDLGIFLDIPKGDVDTMAAHFLSTRLTLAGTEAELKAHSKEEYETMFEEAKQTVEFFQAMLDPNRQADPKRKLEKSVAEEWYDDELEEMEYAQQVPEEAAQPQWKPPAKRPPAKPSEMHIADWLFGGAS